MDLWSFEYFVKAETWPPCGGASACVSAVSLWLSSGMKVLTSQLLPPSHWLDLFHAKAQSASAWHTKHPCLLLARKCRFGKAFLRPPPAFFSSYLFHCSCIVLPSSSGLGALFCLSHYSFHSWRNSLPTHLGGIPSPSSFPRLGKICILEFSRPVVIV